MDKEKNNSAAKIFDKYAAQYEAKYMDIGHYRKSLDIFCERLSTSNPELLELACGPGNITRYLAYKIPLSNILATDLSQAMLELAQKNNPNISTALLDLRSISDLKSKFDGIVCGFGLPYISGGEVQKLVKDSNDLLKENGLIYFSLIENSATPADSCKSKDNSGDELFTYYHDEDFIKKAFDQNNIQLIEISRVKTEENSEFEIDLIMIGKKTSI